jgi:hypothetical protein
VRIRFILTLLLLTNFVVWSWALEKHPKPEIQHVSTHNKKLVKIAYTFSSESHNYLPNEYANKE